MTIDLKEIAERLRFLAAQSEGREESPGVVQIVLGAPEARAVADVIEASLK